MNMMIENKDSTGDRGNAVSGALDAFALNASGSVPVPATLALFGVGLAGLGWSGQDAKPDYTTLLTPS
jgi:hypothetical protein